MQTEKLHKDIKDLIETNKDLSVFHSGGGCEHLAYKGWLINVFLYQISYIINVYKV